MSFWKSLFGGGTGGGEAKPAGPHSSLEHEGYLIEAKPYPESGQYQVAGSVSKVIGGERKEHYFVRADRCVSVDDAAEMAIRKGKQLIEQVGERMFE